MAPAPLGNFVDAVVQLIDRLEESPLDYALGGAIAYGAWAEPRATRDIVLNLWRNREQVPLPYRGHTNATLSASW